MALIKCPECGLSISDKAAACPNCGYPLQPAPVEFEYHLTKHTSDSKGAEFLRVVAWLVWIGGLIVAIITGIVEKETRYYPYTEKAFDWGIFFTALGTYALYGGLIRSVSLLFEDVHDIRNALLSLQLQKTPITVKSPVSKP